MAMVSASIVAVLSATSTLLVHQLCIVVMYIDSNTNYAILVLDR